MKLNARDAVECMQPLGERPRRPRPGRFVGRRHPARSLLGRLLLVLGIAVGLVGVYGIVLVPLFPWLRLWGDPLSRASLFEVLPFAIPAAVAPGLIHLARRCLAPGAAEAVAADARAPVVFLRSFDDDALLLSRDETVWSRLGLSLSRFFLGNEAPFEELLAEGVEPFGPLIAIGDPREALPQLGAARTYVGDGDWQQEVADLLAGCRFVVMQVGASEGLFWEVRRLVEWGRPEKLLLVFPPVGKEELARRWRVWVARCAEAGRPVLPPRLEPHPLVATFSAGWECSILHGHDSTEADYRDAFREAVPRMGQSGPPSCRLSTGLRRKRVRRAFRTVGVALLALTIVAIGLWSATLWTAEGHGEQAREEIRNLHRELDARFAPGPLPSLSETRRRQEELFRKSKEAVLNFRLAEQKNILSWPPGFTAAAGLDPSLGGATLTTEECRAFRDRFYPEQWRLLESAVGTLPLGGPLARVLGRVADWPEQPSAEDCRVAQEDFCVRRELLAAVRKAAGRGASVKRVEFVDSGQAVRDGQLFVGHGRYLHRATPGRRLPVRLVLLMETAGVQHLLVEVANSPLRIQLSKVDRDPLEGEAGAVRLTLCGVVSLVEGGAAPPSP